MPEPLVHSLMYTCKASSDLSKEDIHNILATARRKNPEMGITGVLFYRHGHFLQLLEGEESCVHKLLDAIKNDPRQKDLEVLDECKHVRLFSDWSMDFQLLDPPETIENVRLPPSPLHSEFNQAAIRLRKFLIMFMSRQDATRQSCLPEVANPKLVYSLVYTCMARVPMGEQEIKDILEVSRRNNAARDITGILFYRNNQFLQVLEGEEATILRLMETIRNDTRQTGLAILDEGKHPRLFGGWAMDFKLIDSSAPYSKSVDGFIQLPPQMNQAHMRLRKLLISFMNR